MKKYFFLLIAVLLLMSCNRLMFKVLRPIKPQTKILVDSTNNREIVFIPMVHINKPKFFKGVKSEVDHYRKKGFVVFYEGVGFEKGHDSLVLDTLKRKLRKLIGLQIGDYTAEKNKSLPKFYKNKNFVMQTFDNSGLIKNDFHVDLSAEQIIKKQEEKFGEVKLTECDFQTGFFEEYDCEKLNNFYALHTVRENYITQRVLDSNCQKILMIYGKSHWFFIYPDLYSAGFRLAEDHKGD